MRFSLIVFNFLWCRFEPMDIYPVEPNTMLVVVCFNGGKRNLFRVQVDVTLVDLKDQLNQINQRLSHRGTRKVDGVRYRRPLIDSAGILQFRKMMLTNDDNMRSIFSIFGQHIIFSTINFEVSAR